MSAEKLLEIDNLTLEFPTDYGVVTTLENLSLYIRTHETFAIVGESGSGKSITAQSVMRLINAPPARYPKGRILFEGKDMLQLPMKEIRKIRGDRVSMIFQEPMTSLNPVLTILDQVSEAILLHQNVTKKEAREKTVEILAEVGIPSPEAYLNSYPAQLSGGMRQRVMISMAISCWPKLLIADEPTTALDVTIQAQILELINQVKQDIGMSVLLITHDLGVVAENANHVAVMYLGEIVETAPTAELFSKPRHPYTIGLMNSLPDMSSVKDRFNTIKGSVPDPMSIPKGCKFNDRCPYVEAVCLQERPPLVTITERHEYRCHKDVTGV